MRSSLLSCPQWRSHSRLPRRPIAAAALLAALAALTGCSSGSLTTWFDGAPPTPEEAVRISPADHAKDVRADDRIEISAPDGTLERVRVERVEDAERQEVRGSISADGSTWQPDAATGKLVLAAKYRVHAVALDEDGKRHARTTSFTTHVPDERFIGYFKPENRSTVGTGMIVSFSFNRPVEDRAAVERAIRVTSQPAVPVVGHWFGKERLDFRPRTYWQPGTRVTTDIRLRDVQGAPGVYGIQNKSVGFTVGRHQTSLVDADDHTMTVTRDGEVLSILPISAGSAKNPTYNGKMVVSEMHDVTRMNGRTVGFGGEYDIEDVPHAVRLTTSGTFLHGNYWSRGVFGSTNASHGCIGLRDVKGGSGSTPAGWFFDRTLIGDVVEVVDSSDAKVAPHNGLGGWNMGWEQWTAGSALR
ncbi:L,D-transpeptidase [Streptomyces candidus]|uniref:Lipoprotein-anchoring transpeptidase ErfK/SrfK n=1 Tax=Streptomyces candidus TaxID=67283 RepID=A0A7X0HJU1_9ACTN|nr:Ig-like domain-containing protein [Streptomyces candidus]MBB6437674.1 lipoprotein-anchoring transpeptidase ErfK/SrfK [Streptomyces candidus]GHH53410.1 lipoprotein [Streptomyces candidus]